MKSGDMIVEVDGISTQGMDLTALISKTKGDAGTKVKVTVLRDGHQKNIRSHERKFIPRQWNPECWITRLAISLSAPLKK